MRRIAIALAAIEIAALALALAGGCNSLELDPNPTGASTSTGVGAGSTDAGDEDDDADASDGPNVGDAPISPVLVGITANPAVVGDAGPSPGAVVEARLAALGAGVRVAVVSKSWADLDVAAVAAEASFWADHDVNIALNLAVIDRAVDGRPAPLAGLAWDDPAAIDALHGSIDALLGALAREPAPSLHHVTFGRDVDVYLGMHPDTRDAFVAFAHEACVYTRENPLAPQGLRVGVAFGFTAVTERDPSFSSLLGACDLVVVSLTPDLEEGVAATPTAVAAKLDALMVGAASKPIVLQSVGYPSSPEAGSDDDRQRVFFEAFVDALRPRRDAFDLVNVFQLHDLDPAACQALTEVQPSDASDFPSFFCSMGLLTATGEPKPAWSEVLVGTATFATP